MVTILLALSCILNSVSIILIWVSLRRGNRLGRGASYSDLKRAFELQKKLDEVNASGRDLSGTFNHFYHD